MLQNYYYTVDVYREEEQTDDWGNLDEAGNWVYSHSIEGFLQSRSGNYVQTNQANTPISSHILYADCNIDIEEQDRILVEGQYYRISYTQNETGISGIVDHQEIGADFLNDL